MAGLMVAGAALGAFLNVLFDRITSDRFVDFIRRHKLSDMQKLRNAMNSVRHVLDDAEEKEIREETLKKWLDDLKNAFFAADDLFDEIDYEATRLEREAESRPAIDEFRKFLRPRKSFKKRLRKILETIQDLVNQKDVFGLRENMGGGQSTQRIPTTSVVETSNIFGRVPDREAIMEVLLSDDVNRSNNLSIISIVGLGGIGKTTLGKLIYNDERVGNRFGVRGWVCVSDVFDFPKITAAIAMEVAQMACDHQTLNQIQVELKEKLTGTRLLLVLDDVWNEDFSYWEQLITPLQSGGAGSTIIITTRNDVVATTVRSSSIFRLRKLDSSYCWQLFCKGAFGDQNPQDYPHLEKIGQKIVEKCDGLPLAVKVMGGVLCNNRDARYWEKVLKNDLWKFSKDGILPVLRLSYRYLPSHLKQCFAYCSIFPKDYKFEKEELILLWMAEGFLIEQEGNETMEEVGEEYFEELVSRSFFQHAINNYFVMHDLINDLAGAVAGDFCFRFENQETCRTFERLRYVSFTMVEEESSSRQLSTIFKSHDFKAHVLRTFLPLYATISRQMLQEMIPDLFLNQQRLRVLSLSQCWNVIKLPSSISGLKHLRYLDLSATSIESLPESLCSFYNLQTLRLCLCENLVKLPTKMGRMISMRCLDIQFTELQEMPPNMGKLIKLQTLTDFFVGKREDCGVKELGSLQHLGGTLRIRNLQNVVNAKDVFEANIKCKKNLKELELYWEGETDDPRHEEAVLDGLEPHTEIEVISINGYGGTSFPNWLESGAFSCLKKLRLIRCPNLKDAVPSHLPSSAKLEIEYCPQLQYCFTNAPNISSLGLNIAPGMLFSSSIYLAICNMQESVLEKIGQLGSSFEHIIIAKHEPLECFSLELFPKLKSLKIEDCPHFESFCSPNQGIVSGEFLTELILKDCQKLKCLPERMHSLLPALSTLEIIRCPKIEIFSGDGLPLKLKSLTISNCNKLIARRMHWGLQKLTSLTSFRIGDYKGEEMECFAEVTLLPSVLTSLEICDLPYLKSLNSEGLQHFDSLEKLIINNCPRLQLLPDEGLPSMLTHLEIRDLQNFRFNRRFHDLTCLRELSIFNCPKIASLLEEQLPPNLSTLGLFDLLNLRSVEGLRHFTSLESLTIERCPEIASLPEEGPPPSLITLELYDLQNLRSVKRLRHLTSLESLTIKRCPEIASLPEEGLPPSLITLKLYDLQNLRSAKGLCHLTSLECLIIGRCLEIASLPEEGLPPSLITLKLYDLHNLRSAKGLCHLTSLKCLIIGRCPEIASLPEEGLPPSLISLALNNLQNLRSVKGLCRLTSLKELRIWDCPHLKTLPEEGLPSSLSSLKVWDCPLLKKSYRRNKEKYWAKISHIQLIDIR